MYQLTHQGKQAFSLAKNISKKSNLDQNNIISTHHLVEAMVKVNDSGAGKTLFDSRITRTDVKKELLGAQLVEKHDEKDPSLNYAGMNDPQHFENTIKDNPVPFINEPGANTIMISDREYLVSDYVLYGLKYGKSLLEQRTTEYIETQDLMLGMADVQDSNAFWLLLKLILLKNHGYYAHPYTNIVVSKLDRYWHHDGTNIAKKKQQQAQKNLLSHKLDNPDYSLLNEYGRDLTQLARDKKLPPVIGRDDEVKHLSLVLNRRQKSNALLIGPAGVGKTAIIEGLAQRMTKGELPTLASKCLVALDPDKFAVLMSSGLATKVIDHLLTELSQHRDIILFIDEIQVLRKHGTLDLFDMLKPALARGELQLIGATTPQESQEFFHGDEALMRRFETISVKPLTRTQADQVLARAIAPYENFYQANYTEEAKQAAVDLASYYLSTPLPDSALTILDNAGSLLCADHSTIGHDSEVYLENLHSLEKALSQESQKSLNEAKINELKAKLKVVRSQYEKAKVNSRKHSYKTQIGKDYIIKATETLLGRSLSKADIAKAEQTRVNDSASIFTLAERLNDKIIGQSQAVEALVKGMFISKANLRKPGAPIGSFFFAGLTGTGKTETAKQLAIEEFGSDKALLRFNMPNYNGIFGGDMFISDMYQKISEHPEAVILLDEIEKSNQSVMNILLSIMDDGTLSPASSINPDFSKSIIIMTSNIGAEQLLQIHVGFNTATDSSSAKTTRNTVINAMKRRFSPEFMNRLTKVIAFNQLTNSDFNQITDLLLHEKSRLLLENKISLTWDPNLTSYIVDHYSDPTNGARPLERGIDEFVMNKVAYKLLKHEIKPSQSIKLSVIENKLSIEVSD